MWALWALPALLRSGLCPPAVWVVPHQLRSQNFPCLMGSHEAKKPPANSPPSDLSILKSAASSPVQHHSLPQTHLMPLQLWVFFFFPFRTGSQHCSTRAPLQSPDSQSWHPHCKIPRNAPTLPKSNSQAHPWGILGSHMTWHFAVTPITIQLAPPSPFATHQPISSPETISRFQPVLPPQQVFACTQPLWSFIPWVPSSASKLPAAPITSSGRQPPPPPFPNQPFPGIYTHDSAQLRLHQPQVRLPDVSVTNVLLFVGLGWLKLISCIFSSFSKSS